MTRFIVFALAALLSIGLQATASAQLTRSFNHNFMIADAASVQFDTPDKVVFEAWTSGTMLIETTITLKNASPAILEHVIRTGRYELTMEENGDTYVIKSIHTNRQPIKYRDQLVEEIVVHKVYFPETFSPANTALVREKN